jgi:hypothetical protein
MATIDDKTKIPLFVVIGALPFLVGFVFWLTSVDAKATKGAEAKELLEDLRLDIREIKTDVKYIKEQKWKK